MMDADAIREAKDIDEVVEIINRSKKGELTGNDTRDAELMAGQYAWESANEAEYIADSDIEAHLGFLAECGAEFDFCEAFEHALTLKEFEMMAGNNFKESVEYNLGGNKMENEKNIRIEELEATIKALKQELELAEMGEKTWYKSYKKASEQVALLSKRNDELEDMIEGIDTDEDE